MRLYGIGAVGFALLLAGTSGCSDDAYCYSCGQAGAAPDAATDTNWDGPEAIAWDQNSESVKPDAPETSSSCPYPLEDCDLMAINGCETNLETSAKNCGKCGNACALAHATSKCGPWAAPVSEAGAAEGGGDGGAVPTCLIDKCDTGADGGVTWSDCDKDPANGCESDIRFDSNNCGACGNKCPAPAHATVECDQGECGKVTCDKGWADCDNNLNNGCEADLQSDPLNCGVCSKACPAVAYGQPGCEKAVCGVGSCETGYADCDESKWSGCETELATDVHNCGACKSPCAAVEHGLPKCAPWGDPAVPTCLVDVCDPGFADCNGIPTDGCEVNLASDPLNCAACNNKCPDVFNGTAGCDMFVCGIASCNAGFKDCFGGPSDGCETDTNTDVDHCGSCTTVCASVPDGFRACEAAVCKIGSCDADHADCNTVLADGCESYLPEDANNCGSCGNVCAAPAGATPGCSGGQCGIGTCNPGFADCNQDITDGCEFDITTDANNCGGCNVVCGSGSCTNSVCNCTKSVLLIPDDSATGSALLATAIGNLLPGWTVTTATKPSHQYDGASPAPTGFGAVLILAGGPSPTSYSTDMPGAGQTAIANFVASSNGLVLTEWAAKHVADGRWQTLKDLVLLNRTVAFSGQVTYKVDTGFKTHPLWAGLQESFVFASTSNVGVTKVATGVKRLAGSPEAIDAVAIRDLPSQGRVVHLAHAGNYASNGWSNVNIQKLVANAVQWSARCN